MPRSEGFLDPGAGPLAAFAWDLRALREKSGGMPYRVLAKRAGFCASTLSVAASGAKLPSLDVTLAYVQACGGDPEPWRARWHVLAAQYPPTRPGPSAAQPALHVAPPYDADENDIVRLEPVTFAQAVAVAPAPAVHEEHEELSGRPRLRSRFHAVPVGRVATVALTLATAFLSLRMVTSEGTGNAPVTGTGMPLASTSPGDTAMQQADALYTLIYQFTPWRSDANDAIWDVSGCRNLSNAQSKLRAIARKRQEQVEQLAALDVSKLPDNARLVAALKHAWITSAQSDTAYANIAADLESGCTSGAVRTDPNYQQADADAQAAAAAKAEAAQLWNANADALGQLWIKGAEL